MSKPAKKKIPKQRGPEADRLKLKGDWKAAVKKSYPRRSPLRDGQRRGKATMSFTAKVRATGELFNATTDLGSDKKQFRDAHTLDVERYYGGHLFPGSSVGSSQYVEFSEAESAIFLGSELEEVSGDIRLVPFR